MFKKLAVSVMMLVIILGSGQFAITNTAGMPGGYTAAPGDLGGCGDVACHNAAPYPGPLVCGTIEVKATPAAPATPTYTTNTSYFILLNQNSLIGPASTYGFQLTALDPSGNMAGSFNVIASSGAQATEISTQGGRDYMSQKSATSQNAWVFTWNSPSSYLGDVTFYLTNISGNGNSAATGDVYCEDVLVLPGAQQPSGVTANFTSDVTATCINGDVTFTDNSLGSVTSWNWNFGTGASPATATGAGPHAINYNQVGTADIQLIVSDGVDADTITSANYITVSSGAPAFAGNDTSVCDGSSITLTATGGTSYVWSSGGTQATESVSPTTPTTYTVTVTDATGCTGVDDVLVTVNALPTVNVPDQNFCPGSFVTLDAGNPGSTYQWLPNGETTQTVNANMTGNYFVTVTDVNGCTATDFSKVGQGSNLSISIPDTSLCGGASVVLDAGNPGSTYLWSPGGEITQTITVSSAGSYAVTVTDGACSGADTSIVSLSGGVAADAGVDIGICLGESTVIGTSGATGNTYSWLPITGLNDPTLAQPTASPSSTTTYILTVSDGSCDDMDTLVVTVNAQPVVSFSGLAGPYCDADNSPITLTGNPTGGTFSGTGVSINDFTPSLAGAGTFAIIYDYTDPSTLCSASDTQSVTITGKPTATILNVPDSICTTDPIFTPQGSPAGGTFFLGVLPVPIQVVDPSQVPGGTYTVSYIVNNGPGCADTATKQVTVVDLSVNFSGLASSYCSSDTVNYPMVAGTAGGTFSGPGVTDTVFNPANAGIGVHDIVYAITDPGTGCTFADTLTVTVSGIEIVGRDVAICEGGIVTLTATGGLNYLWSTFAVGPSITVAPSATTTYFVSGLDSNSCPASDTITVTVTAPPVAQLFGLEIEYCSADGIDTLSGFPGNGSFFGTGVNSNTFNPSVVPIGSPLSISYRYADTLGCSDTVTLITSVKQTPSINFTGLDPEYCNVEEAVLLNGSPQGGFFTGRGVSNDVFVPFFAGVGTHSINYTVFPANGCIASAISQVVVRDLPQVSLSVPATMFCENDEPVELTVSPTNGMLDGIGISGSTFDPELAGTGGPYLLTYSFTDSNTCVGSDEELVTVKEKPAIAFAGLAPQYCENEGAVSLAGSPAMGVFSGSGISGSTFAPVLAGSGTHDITFDYTGMNGCSDTIIKTTTVNPADTILSVDLADTYCQNGLVDFVDGVPSGGTFTGPGIVGSAFDPEVAGSGGPYSITYELTNLFGCTSSFTKSVTVFSVPVISFINVRREYCELEGPVALNAIPVGGSFTGAGINDTTFDPEAAGTGEHILEYSFTNADGCETVEQVTVNVNDCVGIEEYVNGGNIKVYPNPFHTNFNAVYTAQDAGKATLTVRNVLGINMSVKHFEVNTGINELNVETADWSSGLYFIEILQGNISYKARLMKH